MLIELNPIENEEESAYFSTPRLNRNDLSKSFSDIKPNYSTFILKRI